ncbi:MAG: hypothetical protein OEW35_03950 [Gammaproteobacteria bacterium]|nr:hypothetical protein [Gammaproteobacteria bacterium]MDH4253510.1 hypothetical protein [Gammaproteobacteria bacterium]MDH5309743.1 hypothetical protein [Gammaproteobacteria bacterium]
MMVIIGGDGIRVAALEPTAEVAESGRFDRKRLLPGQAPAR